MDQGYFDKGWIMIDDDVKKLQEDVVGIKTDLVWMLYLIERIDKNVQAMTRAESSQSAEEPLDITGWKIEKF
jgi:hypothetical protein